MRLPETLPTQEHVKKWWFEWRKVDFSWSSLASKPHTDVSGSDEKKSLQDYWRSDPRSNDPSTDAQLLKSGELESDPSGRLWHILHTPLNWDDGSPTWKLDRAHEKWGKFWECVKARLEATTTGGLFNEDTQPPPKTAPFAGIVFGETPHDWNWHKPSFFLNAEFHTCAFLGKASFGGVESTVTLEIRHCLFYGQSEFDRLEIKEDLTLISNTFLSSFWMDHSKISGSLKVKHVHFCGETTMLAGRIRGETEIALCIFYGPCGFEGTKFGRGAKISWCQFLDTSSFTKTSFYQDTSFIQTRFVSDVSFTGRSAGKFYFLDCVLESDGDFAFLRFRREASFAATRFKGTTRFHQVKFKRKASFLNSVFESNVSFAQVCFDGPIEFRNAVFQEVADMTGIKFPSNACFYHAAFRGADFRRVADFTMRNFSAWGAFSETSFQQTVLFERTALESDTLFEEASRAAEKAALAPLLKEDGSNNETVMELNRRFGELEAAFRSLKQGMAKQQARREEHRFYRFELLARRKHSRTSFFERLMIWAYEKTSLSGTSIVRPVIGVMIIILLFGLGYWASSKSLGELAVAINPNPLRSFDPDLIDAMRFSFQNAIQPLSAWDHKELAAGSRQEWVNRLLGDASAERFLVIRIIATLESALSISLLFLFGLGIKRHFQMQG